MRASAFLTPGSCQVRLAVYTDYVYVRAGGEVYAERAFSFFLARLATRLDALTLIGRLNPAAGQARYPIPPGSRFAALPYYESLAHPIPVLRSTSRSLRTFWRALDEVDAVWLLGPHPLAIAFAAVALARRRRVFLGVRADLPVYVRRRHPGRRAYHLAADALDAVWRALSRFCPAVVVGPELRRRYRSAGSLLEIAVSLVEQEDLVDLAVARSRDYGSELTILSVGRIAEEKNPLALATVLATLCAAEPDRWRLLVCGEGPLEAPLAARLVELGVADRAELRGYVAAESMPEAYRSSHLLFHSSWTEGLPQVLIEAFAAGLPVVATDVGGIREAVGGAVELVAPGDDDAAVGTLRRLADSGERRSRLVEEGLAYAREHTIDREVDRLAGFLTAAPRV